MQVETCAVAGIAYITYNLPCRYRFPCGNGSLRHVGVPRGQARAVIQQNLVAVAGEIVQPSQFIHGFAVDGDIQDVFSFNRKSAHKSERPDKIFGYENTGKLPFAASVFRMVIQLLLP